MYSPGGSARNQDSSSDESNQRPKQTAPETPWAAFSGPDHDDVKVAFLRAQIFDISNSLTSLGKSDLSELTTLFSEYGINITGLIGAESISALGIDATLAVFHEVGIKIFLPRNEILSVSFVGDRAAIFHGNIDPTSWKKYPYIANTSVWSAQVEWFITPPCMFGLSVENIAVVDGSGTRSDALPMYKFLMLNQKFNSPVLEELGRALKRVKMSKDVYVTYFGEKRLLNEQLGHARQNILCNLLSPGTVASYDEPDRIRLILRPTSTLNLLLEYAKPKEWVGRMLACSIGKFAAKLNGLIFEMGEFIEANELDLAYISFLDSIATSVMIRNTKDNRSTANIHSILDFATTHLFSTFLELGIKTDIEIINYVNSKSTHPALVAYELINRLYKKDFWTDRELEKRVVR